MTKDSGAALEERVRFVWGDGDWHDGPGWYYIDREYPDEGSCGAFTTRLLAWEHARDVFADELAEDGI